ncbi:alpha/beta fold hydrolase [Maricaulis sp. D1M11]|uniref:alpha/beta fold hydrolase n=1 Tax=Maricaulis sp. D1M11 TaxID=3076117 RepID=UPI0039B69149
MTEQKAHAPRPPAPLTVFKGERPPAPEWFTKALAHKTDSGSVEVKGAQVRWKAWGRRGQPGLVLVHGGVAHKDWWDSIGPFLADTRRVVALDLSGMGDSDHRNAYHMDIYAEEVMTAAREGGAFDGGRPFIAGHSFGGFVTLTVGMSYGDQLKGVAVLDSPIRPLEKQRSSAPPSRGGNVYSRFEDALMRFRLLPEQSCDNAFLLDHIARMSLKQVDHPKGGEGWTWKFDPYLWPKLEYNRKPPEEVAATLKCPLALFRGSESSLVTDEVWDFMRTTFGETTSMVSIQGAQHHLILDQPLAVASALEVLTGPGWQSR